ncbi:thiol reductant ABC exporter subunit CydD [Sedimenticola thiotaurini]|uniref:Cysteine ABC transporter permease n=1 Tax=Sedimenticola thiotaurini TaxID=1543721 RepID=A0A0F7K230_9GAMM|nr:thiol reductant ABC exporter subunit CydD [Sedimenticola thiotaurini]AKH21609.1 cysteine ABC transporter permease [Sedimenticola thiotaurini]
MSTDLKQWLKEQKPLAGRHLSVATGLGVLAGFLLIFQAWCLARVVDGVVFADQSLDQQWPWLSAMLGLFVGRAVLAWAAEQTAVRGAGQVKVALRDRLVRHIQALGPVALAAEHSGELANTLSDGIEALEAYYARFLPAISLMALVPLSILVFVFPVDLTSALVLLLTAPLIPLFMILIGKGAERLNQRQWKKLARMSAHFLDVIQGLTNLKLFNASRREAAVIARISDDYRRSTMSVLRVAFLSAFALEFFSTVSIAIVAVLIGFRLFWGELDFFSGLFLLLLAPEFYLPLRNMGTHYHARMEAVGAAERIVEILQTPVPEIPSRTLSLDISNGLAVRFEDVCFGYEAGRPALQGIDFTLHPGERLALVGPSGSGKSTLMNLLLGFIRPQQGRIMLNEVAINSLHPDAWRQLIAWVPQNPRLFHGTLLDNIRLARPDAPLDAVRQAAQLAQADDFIMALPDAYQTRVGDRGQGLSGGQIQRVALARAFLKDAPLVLLDEATASLDQQSEQLVQAGIEQLAKGRSLITIAHRLQTVRDADRLLVLENGRIVESGAPAVLRQQGGYYSRLAALQEGTV